MRALRDRIGPEDWLLFGWAALAQPVFFSASAASSSDLFTAPASALLGGLYVLAGGGAVVAMLTRDAEAAAAHRPAFSEEELSGIGPTAAGVVLVFLVGFELLGGRMPDLLIGGVFLVTLISALFRNRLPAVVGTTRRVFITPFVMAAAGLFDQVIVTIVGLFDLSLIGSVRTSDEIWLFVTLVGIGVAVSVIFYSMLILAPRRLAGDHAGRWTWVARYLLFVVTVLIGVTLSSAIG